MAPTHDIIEIRSLIDLLSLFNICADITLTKEQYSHPLRPYRLIQPEASCQYQKKGTRCSKLHQLGFVVELKDGSNVLIGHCCAHNHLGLHDAEVKGALKQLSATEHRNIRRHKVETLLLQRDAFVERVRAANIRHRGLLDRIDQILQVLPERVGIILKTRWKSSQLEVLWDYQIIKKGIDEKGKTYEERHWYPHSFGNLKGMGLWLQLGQQRYQERLLDFRRQLEAIPSKIRLTNAQVEQAEAVFNRLTELTVIEREIQSQAKLIDEFLNPANLEMVIQLTSNQKIRSETVLAVHQLRNETCSMAPEKYVAEIDRMLKQRYSAGAIRISE
ncbi:hypothetical protein BK653_03150 [Pseudomonas brassicacearum]|uniref:hypothetical protein n=1 Tax=Pseudomonas brassicacearum TaxID=930166 RepID=UPI000F460CE5|nr:hypothetical protein [Pseudomonas brassicacearum]ROM70894.1 hypothetical protein BK653_03150 [Pseudomonas brassicacearum]